MPLSMRRPQPTLKPDEGVDEQVSRIGAMSIGELRRFWKERHGSEPPPFFSKDLLARAIAYRLQEETYGGLGVTTARLLKSLVTKPGAEPPRRVKVGSVIVREHKGVLHEVMVVPSGFCWQGETYESLSCIARKITGISWSGPRFFGLRSRKETGAGSYPSEAVKAPSASQDAEAPSKQTPQDKSRKVSSAHRVGRRSGIRTGARG